MRNKKIVKAKNTPVQNHLDKINKSIANHSDKELQDYYYHLQVDQKKAFIEVCNQHDLWPTLRKTNHRALLNNIAYNAILKFEMIDLFIEVFLPYLNYNQLKNLFIENNILNKLTQEQVDHIFDRKNIDSVTQFLLDILIDHYSILNDQNKKLFTKLATYKDMFDKLHKHDPKLIVKYTHQVIHFEMWNIFIKKLHSDYKIFTLMSAAQVSDIFSTLKILKHLSLKQIANLFCKTYDNQQIIVDALYEYFINLNNTDKEKFIIQVKEYKLFERLVACEQLGLVQRFGTAIIKLGMIDIFINNFLGYFPPQELNEYLSPPHILNNLSIPLVKYLLQYTSSYTLYAPLFETIYNQYINASDPTIDGKSLYFQSIYDLTQDLDIIADKFNQLPPDRQDEIILAARENHFDSDKNQFLSLQPLQQEIQFAQTIDADLKNIQQKSIASYDVITCLIRAKGVSLVIANNFQILDTAITQQNTYLINLLLDIIKESNNAKILKNALSFLKQPIHEMTYSENFVLLFKFYAKESGETFDNLYHTLSLNNISEKKLLYICLYYKKYDLIPALKFISELQSTYLYDETLLIVAYSNITLNEFIPDILNDLWPSPLPYEKIIHHINGLLSNEDKENNQFHRAIILLISKLPIQLAKQTLIEVYEKVGASFVTQLFIEHYNMKDENGLINGFLTDINYMQESSKLDVVTRTISYYWINKENYTTQILAHPFVNDNPKIISTILNALYTCNVFDHLWELFDLSVKYYSSTSRNLHIYQICDKILFYSDKIFGIKATQAFFDIMSANLDIFRNYHTSQMIYGTFLQCNINTMILAISYIYDEYALKSFSFQIKNYCSAIFEPEQATQTSNFLLSASFNVYKFIHKYSRILLMQKNYNMEELVALNLCLSVISGSSKVGEGEQIFTCLSLSQTTFHTLYDKAQKIYEVAYNILNHIVIKIPEIYHPSFNVKMREWCESLFRIDLYEKQQLQEFIGI